jgi:hypothetical protein
MLYIDTMDKIVNYLSAVSTESICYKGKQYNPKPLFVSKGIIQGYTCPENCGGCCPRFSLDYLPSEKEKQPFH